MISVFKKKLNSELSEAIRNFRTNESNSFQPTHKSKQENHSFESIASALSVSTGAVSADCTTALKEQAEYKDSRAPST